jgi:hypothetical protein
MKNPVKGGSPAKFKKLKDHINFITMGINIKEDSFIELYSWAKVKATLSNQP